MPKQNVKHVDSKGRITIPGLANATVIVERVSQSEFRIKRAQVISESDLEFHEESFPIQLSERDARAYLYNLENPPKPNAAAIAAAKEFVRDYGHPLDLRKIEP